MTAEAKDYLRKNRYDDTQGWVSKDHCNPIDMEDMAELLEAYHQERIEKLEDAQRQDFKSLEAYTETKVNEALGGITNGRYYDKEDFSSYMDITFMEITAYFSLTLEEIARIVKGEELEVIIYGKEYRLKQPVSVPNWNSPTIKLTFIEIN
jgi:hypothetical protein